MLKNIFERCDIIQWGKQNEDGSWCCMPHCEDAVNRNNASKNKKISKNDKNLMDEA